MTTDYNFYAEVSPQGDFEIEARLVRDGVPATLHEGLLRYLRQGVIPGGFLTAVLQGDLFKAAVTADRENRDALGQIAMALVWALPEVAFGSREKVDRWAKAARERNPKGLFEPLVLR
jgi:hypothetical protein